jgi:dienelactone hydrolase
MPAIVICPSHHRPKEQGELQDMGMTWARSGAVVLVLDNLGHGERRQQPFGGREDYHWRYNMGIQLHLVGQSLMGWMVADLQRCLDAVLSRQNVDPRRLILLGAVAGGGDPAAVTAALDSRVTGSIPFNFGGGSRLEGERTSYTYVGGGSWESTRTLRLSGRDGFFPWFIVASVAPRHLIFAREFELDGASDLAWRRVRGVYEIYDAAERVAEIHGFGHLPFRPPISSPCTNVGRIHRRQIYPLLEKWFGMSPPREYSARLEAGQLSCLTSEVQAQLLHQVLTDVAGEQLSSQRKSLSSLELSGRRGALRAQWQDRLGDIAPEGTPKVVRSETSFNHTLRVERVLLEIESRIQVPLILLSQEVDKDSPAKPGPVVIGIAQQGKQAFLVRRAHEIAQLLEEDFMVCLPDLRGTGETEPDSDRTYSAISTQLSALELKLGGTVLGSQLRDLRGIIRYLSTRHDVDTSRLGLWGDSLGEVNPPEFVDPPLRTDLPPHHAEPMGTMLALLAALYEDNVQAVLARGGLVSYASILDASAFYVPHDAIVPGWLEIGDVSDLVAVLTPMPLRLQAFVDGRNRLVNRQRFVAEFSPAVAAYETRPDRLRLEDTCENAGEWLAGNITGNFSNAGNIE